MHSCGHTAQPLLDVQPPLFGDPGPPQYEILIAIPSIYILLPSFLPHCREKIYRFLNSDDVKKEGEEADPASENSKVLF